LGKYQGKEQSDGSLKIEKSYEKLSEENAELADEYNQITKLELIQAIKKLVDRINQIEGNVEGDENYLSVGFTFDNLKNEI
jgi:hypothetical protein